MKMEPVGYEVETITISAGILSFA